MHWIKPALILLLSGLICAGDSSLEAQEPKQILLAYEDIELAPFILGDSAAIPEKKPGLSIELMNMTAAHLGLHVRFIRTPWHHCKRMLKRGTVDGIFNASFKESRRDIGCYPYVEDGQKPDSNKRTAKREYFFYTLKDSSFNWDGESASNLNSLPTCVMHGYSAGSDLRKLKIPVYESKTLEKALDLLLKKRIAAYVDLEGKVEMAIQKEPSRFANIRRLKVPLATKDYYLMFSNQFMQKNPDLAKSFWAKLEQVRESPAYQKLKQEYNKALSPKKE